MELQPRYLLAVLAANASTEKAAHQKRLRSIAAHSLHLAGWHYLEGLLRQPAVLSFLKSYDRDRFCCQSLTSAPSKIKAPSILGRHVTTLNLQWPCLKDWHGPQTALLCPEATTCRFSKRWGEGEPSYASCPKDCPFFPWDTTTYMMLLGCSRAAFCRDRGHLKGAT